MKLKLNEQGNVVVQDGKPVYIHDDGKEVAFDAPAAVSKIASLNSEAKGHRERAEGAESKLKVFDGIEDAEGARKALETLKNIDEGKLIAAGKVEEIKAAAAKAAQEQVAAANKAHAEELARTKSDLEKTTAMLYAEKIGGSFNRSKFIADRSAIPADLMQARFGAQFKVEDGKIIAYDNAGNKIFSRSKPGEVAEFDEALETLVDQYPYRDQILKGSGASGMGAQGGAQGVGSGGRKTITRADFAKLSPADQMKAGREMAITD